MLLTHDEKSSPIALFVDKNDVCTSLPIVMDERLFSDTVLRVIQLKPAVFLACDIRVLNGISMYDTLSYASRRGLLETLLDAFHHTDLTAVVSYDKVPDDSLIRGWEYYDNEPGTMGVFLPAKE